jgi:hypothetical protein
VSSLLDQLFEELTARQFKVLFDKKRLGAGMEWRPVLHRWLGECDGAVVFFSPKALDSDWMLKESTILTWRKSLGSQVRLLPVLVGCRRDQVVEHRAYKPLDIGSLQFLRYDQTRPTEQAAEALLRELIDKLATLQPDASDEPLRQWIREVGLLLGKVDPVEHLERAAAGLDIAADARSLFTDLPTTVAHQLLHSDLSHTHRAFKSLHRGLNKDQFERLVGLVVPTWVRLEAAAHVRGVLGRPPGGRMLAINSDRPPTGKDYLVRATCGEAERGHMVTVCGVVGGDDEKELLASYRLALWREVGYVGDPDPELLRELLNIPDAPFHILLRADAARPILVPHGESPSSLAQHLLAAYQHATFVFLIRDPALWAAAGNVTGIERIAPELFAQDEIKAMAQQRAIEMLLDPSRKEASLSG